MSRNSGKHNNQYENVHTKNQDVHLEMKTQTTVRYVFA